MSKMKRKNTIIVALVMAIIVVLCLSSFCFYILGDSEQKNNVGDSRDNSARTKETEEEIPLSTLFSKEKKAEYLRKNQYQHKPEKILPEPSSSKDGKRKTLIRPEEAGEDYSLKNVEYILCKLSDGTKIEKRKAVNELWGRFGMSQTMPSETEQEMIAKATEGYLATIKDDFEESFMQIQRLWHLAVPALLKNVTAQDVSVSENAARLLSVMKTPQIIDKLISDSNKAQSRNDTEKYIFALEYMKINNPYFLDNRSRMSDSECDAYYKEYVSPQVSILKQKLLKGDGIPNQ